MTLAAEGVRSVRRPRAVPASWSPWTSPLLAAGAVALWVNGVLRIDVATIGGVGLAGSLNAEAWAGLALLTSAFAVELSHRAFRPTVVAGLLLALVFFVDGLAPLVESTAANPVAWIHVGFADYILRNGATYHNFDARFSWPGAFALGAWLTSVAGRPSAAVFTAWTPPVLDAITLIPLRLLLRHLAPSSRIAWGAMWLFVLGNWFNEDYFSPQGLVYVIALSVLAIGVATGPRLMPLPARGVRALGRTLRDRLAADPTAVDGLGPRQCAVVTVSLVACAFAIVVSHQLTPYALVVLLSVLAVCGRLSWRAYPLVILVLAVGWISLGARDYWAGHLSALTGGVGTVGSTIQQNVVGRARGGHVHLVVIWMRLLLSAGFAACAGMGSLVSHRRGRRSWVLEGLALAPFGLLALQSYGGEVILRADLFALPAIAALAVRGYAVLGHRRPVAAAGAAVGAAAVVVLTLVARHGNAAFTTTTPSEIGVVNAAYRIAAPGATLAVMSQNLAWKFRDIDRVTTVSYERQCGALVDVACLRRVDADLVIVTQGQRRYAQLVQGVDEAAWNRLLDVTLPSGGYRVVFANEDGMVYAHTGVSVPLAGAETTYLEGQRVRSNQ